MKAMILAAGLGTRLRPLTDSRPKALVELNGRTLLEITITRLASFGVTEFVVNVHHFAERVFDYLHSKNNFGFRIEISREDHQLLDTGGGLQKAAWFFQENPSRLDEPFFLHNVDVLSNIDLNAMLQFHKQNQALATLAVQSRPSSRQLLFNENLQLSGRRISGHDSVNRHSERSEESAFSSHSPLATHHSPLPQSKESSSGSSLLHPLAFSGIHVLSPRLLPLLTESTPPFSIIDSYLRLSSQSQKILAFRHDSSYWRDLGKSSDLSQASLDLQQNTPL